MGEGKITFREVLRIGEFRAIWGADALSQLGDPLARVAIALLIFDRTNSPLLTALSYALASVPTLLGGALFGTLADRFSRRTVMVSCDLLRIGLVVVMAIPGLGVPALLVLLFVMVMLGGPFRAAQLSLMADVLEGERYTVGLAVRNVTVQAAQLAGYGIGGALVAATNPQVALLIDAATFAWSAAWIRFGVKSRAPIASGERRNALLDAAQGMSLCWRDHDIRRLMTFSALVGLYVVPEGLAAPYARSIGHGDVATGILMAADPIGSVIGGLVIGRWVSSKWSTKNLGILAVVNGIPLLLCAANPGLIGSTILFALSGFFITSYLIPSGAAMAHAAPPGRKAHIMGLNSTIVIASQGLMISLAGVVTTVLAPGTTIALLAAVGIAASLLPAIRWTRQTPTTLTRWLPAAQAPTIS